MVKVEIVGKPARKGGKVVGTIRFLSEDDKRLGEYPFSEDLSTVAGFESTADFEAYAIGKVKKRLASERLEQDWAKVEKILGPLVVEDELVE